MVRRPHETKRRPERGALGSRQAVESIEKRRAQFIGPSKAIDPVGGTTKPARLVPASRP